MRGLAPGHPVHDDLDDRRARFGSNRAPGRFTLLNGRPAKVDPVPADVLGMGQPSGP
jgi:hypothetical protein